jgi:hypothetical protein
MFQRLIEISEVLCNTYDPDMQSGPGTQVSFIKTVVILITVNVSTNGLDVSSERGDE